MVAWFDDLQDRLASRPVGVLEAGSGLRRAAVLVPLFVAGGEIWVLFTRRAATLLHHAGEIAFPGGLSEEGDEDEVATALREAGEEIGLDGGTVMVLGQLDQAPTTSGYLISPVVGAVPESLALEVNPDEVAEVLRLPLLYLARPELVEDHELVVGDVRAWSPVLHYRRHRIAGATARILVDLLERLELAPG